MYRHHLPARLYTQRPAPASSTEEPPESDPSTVTVTSELTSSSARASLLRPKASTRTVVSPLSDAPATGCDTSTPSACSVTPEPENSPLPCTVATSWPPTNRRADVTGPVRPTRKDTRPDTLCPDNGAHVDPSAEYSTSPTTGRA